MKSSSNFKMSKQSKRYLATIVDSQRRGEIKRGTVQAELASQQQVRQPRGDRK
jgi:hypothetical protein